MFGKARENRQYSRPNVKASVNEGSAKASHELVAASRNDGIVDITKIIGRRSKGSALHHFKFASGEVATFAGKTRATGCLRLSAPISVARLAGIPIKCASGASKHQRKH
jgi:hypothetical protein